MLTDVQLREDTLRRDLLFSLSDFSFLFLHFFPLFFFFSLSPSKKRGWGGGKTQLSGAMQIKHFYFLAVWRQRQRYDEIVDDLRFLLKPFALEGAEKCIYWKTAGSAVDFYRGGLFFPFFFFPTICSNLLERGWDWGGGVGGIGGEAGVDARLFMSSFVWYKKENSLGNWVCTSYCRKKGARGMRVGGWGRVGGGRWGG